MTTVKLPGEELVEYVEWLVGYTNQALPYRLSKAMGAARVALHVAQQAFASELRPFVQKHSGGPDFISARHPNYAAFREEAKEVLRGEVEVELEPIPLRLIEEAAEIMEERAKQGVGEPMLIVFERQEALKAAGIIVENGAKAAPKKPTNRRRKKT